jgi:hypothetical protein
MTTYPRLAGHDFHFQSPPPSTERAHPVIWFTAALVFCATGVLGVSAWALDWGYLIAIFGATIVSIAGGLRAQRKNNKRDTKEAVREAVAPAVHEAVAPAVREAVAPAVNKAIEASPFPTEHRADEGLREGLLAVSGG